jgi:hypothetical protein
MLHKVKSRQDTTQKILHEKIKQFESEADEREKSDAKEN